MPALSPGMTDDYVGNSMPLKITTWNINSVRLRIDLVAKFLKSARPDVLCLQETKCPDDAFPLKRFQRLGYEHAALNGQKGYHGVAVLSRVPFERFDVQNFCGKTDCRHISVVLGERAGLRDPLTLHNFYVPAGGDEPDPEINAKFEHKLDFLDEMRAHAALRPAASQRAILVGDLNVAPLEHDVWSHKQMLKVVSHTPIECEKLAARAESRQLDRHHARAHAGAGEALHLVELSRDGQLEDRRPRPPARSRLDLGRAGRPRLEDQDRQGLSRRRAPVRPRAGDGDGGDITGVTPRSSPSPLHRAEFARPASSRAAMMSRNFTAASG